jgi:5-methylcytosine-specific restriction protein B
MERCMTKSNHAIQDVVAKLRERALQNDGALFSDDSIWTIVNLRALWVALTKERADLRRLESLGEQLRGVDEEVVRLAAELFWLIYLIADPSCISHARKTNLVRTIYEWSGHTLSPTHPLLVDLDLPPHGSLGLFYSARRTSELMFLIKALVGIKKRSSAERATLLADPLATGNMLDEAAGEELSQLNHVLRHLLFPDYFEAIFTRRDKCRIVETFTGIPRKEVRRWNSTQLDVELASIHKQLQELNKGQSLSFFREPLLSSWRPSSSQDAVTVSEQRFWVEKVALENRPDRQQGPHSMGRALCVPRQPTEGDDATAVVREVEPGDVVFHFIENVGITGVSLVEGEIQEDFIFADDSPWAGDLGYRIQLTDFAEVTPALGFSELLFCPKFQERLRQLANLHPSLIFNRQLSLNRGCYLSEAPEALVRIFNEAYLQTSNRNLPKVILPEQEDLPADEIAEYVRYPIAQILSGPSGAGKTHTAMARAVEICDGAAPGNHERLKDRYEKLHKEGRIRLVTFHPSLEYADFMERREYAPQQPEESAATTHPTVRPGVFKQIADDARADQGQQDQEVDFGSATVWKLTPQADTDDDTVYRDLLESGLLSYPSSDRVDFSGCINRAAVKSRLAEKTGQAPDDDVVSGVDQLVNQMATGDFVILVDDTAACRGVGRISGGYLPMATAGQNTYSQCRPVDWLFIPEEPLPWTRIARKQFLERMLYRIDLPLIKLPELSNLLEQKQAESRNYVLIIDEIGRGDVDGIFGELVTLIDKDKRAGAPNALTVTLPLSGEQFSVPSNLYLIGTLNSADPLCSNRADILNRRFQIMELEPDESLIRGDDQLGSIPDCEEGRIDLRSLMLAINRRLEYLVGQEYRFGHSYFMQVQSYEELVDVIHTRVIPRLKKIFNNDWHKIQLIFRDIREDGKPNLPQLVSHEAVCMKSEFGFQLDEETPRCRFWVTPERDLNPEAFRKVYSDL